MARLSLSRTGEAAYRVIVRTEHHLAAGGEEAQVPAGSIRPVAVGKTGQREIYDFRGKAFRRSFSNYFRGEFSLLVFAG